MNVFEALTVYDYATAITGVLGVILGIAQLCTKKCIGLLTIGSYTEASARKFTLVSGVIYLVGGIVTAVAPFVVKFINAQNFGFSLPSDILIWIVIAVVAIVLIAQFSILKRKLWFFKKALIYNLDICSDFWKQIKRSVYGQQHQND